MIALPRQQQIQQPDHPFESESFYETWWETLAPKFQPIRREGQVVLVNKPIFKGRLALKTLRITGWNNHYYQGFSDERLEEFRFISRKTAWDYFEFYGNSAYVTPNIQDLFAARGLIPLEYPAMATQVIDISQGWNAYWEAQGSKYRRDLSKKLGNATHLNPQLVFYTGSVGIEAFFSQFFHRHLAYWAKHGGGSYFQDPREQDFIKRWAAKLDASGQLMLTGLLMGGEVVNLGMNIICNNNLYGLLTINTGKHTEMHPGLINMHLTLQHAAQLGLDKMDIGPGDTDYKKKLATHQETGFKLLVINPKSVAGQLYGSYQNRRYRNPESQTASLR